MPATVHGARSSVNCPLPWGSCFRSATTAVPLRRRPGRADPASRAWQPVPGTVRPPPGPMRPGTALQTPPVASWRVRGRRSCPCAGTRVRASVSSGEGAVGRARRARCRAARRHHAVAARGGRTEPDGPGRPAPGPTTAAHDRAGRHGAHEARGHPGPAGRTTPRPGCRARTRYISGALTPVRVRASTTASTTASTPGTHGEAEPGSGARSQRIPPCAVSDGGSAR